MRPSHADLAVERAELDNFLDAVGGMILTASIRDFALREGQRRAARSRARGHADTVLRAFAEAYREIIANLLAEGREGDAAILRSDLAALAGEATFSHLGPDAIRALLGITDDGK